MKSALMAMVVVLLIGCGTTAKKDDTSAKGDSIEKNHQTTDNDYLIRDSLVGTFEIGKPIPFPGTSDNYEISQELLTRIIAALVVAIGLGYWLIRASKARDKSSTGKPKEKPHI